MVAEFTFACVAGRGAAVHIGRRNATNHPTSLTRLVGFDLVMLVTRPIAKTGHFK